MDQYGYGSAMQMALALFETSRRGTGRTEHLVQIVQRGDVVICANGAEAQRIERLLRGAGKIGGGHKEDVRVYARPPSDPLHDIRPGSGRVYFDHAWVYGFWERSISSVEREFASLTKQVNSNSKSRRDDLEVTSWEPMNEARRSAIRGVYDRD